MMMGEDEKRGHSLRLGNSVVFAVISYLRLHQILQKKPKMGSKEPHSSIITAQIVHPRYSAEDFYIKVFDVNARDCHFLNNSADLFGKNAKINEKADFSAKCKTLSWHNEMGQRDMPVCICPNLMSQIVLSSETTSASSGRHSKPFSPFSPFRPFNN